MSNEATENQAITDELKTFDIGDKIPILFHELRDASLYKESLMLLAGVILTMKHVNHPETAKVREFYRRIKWMGR